jgi:choline-sulfatase
MLTGKIPPGHGVRDNGTFRLDERHTTLTETLRAAGYNTAAFLGAFVLERRYGLAQGFDTYDDDFSHRRVMSSEHYSYAERRANEVADSAIAWLRRHEETDPAKAFFVWCHFFDPHRRYDPPEPYASQFVGRPYDGEIAFADEHTGRVLDCLGELRRGDQTIVVVVGDHGEGLGEHDEATHALLIYESTMHVPMIWYCPALLDGDVVVDDRVVATTDIAPTLLDLLGMSTSEAMDGVSLLRPESLTDRAVYMETLVPQLAHGWAPLFALRRHRDKYIDAPTPEYYDLLEDPHELTNLFAARPSSASELAAQLQAVMSMFPAGQLADRVVPDAAEIARLESLGYVAAAADPSDASNLDPKEMIKGVAEHEQGLKLNFLGQYAEAEAVFRREVEAAPGDALAWVGLSDALAGLGRADEAIEAMRRASALQPEAVNHWYSLARMCLDGADSEAFQASLAEAERLDPHFGGAPLLRGRRALKEGDYGAAVKHFERARQIDPSRYGALASVGIGEVYRIWGDDQAARRALADALDRDPTQLDALLLYADIEEQAGRLEEAAAYAERAWQARRTSSNATRLAQLYLRLGRGEQAVAVLREFVSVCPRDARAWSNLGNILFKLGRLVDAVDAYKRANSVDPDYWFAHYNLGEALRRQGDFAGALDAYRRAIRLRPDDAPGRLELVQVLIALGQLDAAIDELSDWNDRAQVDWATLESDPALQELLNHPRVQSLRGKRPSP